MVKAGLFILEFLQNSTDRSLLKNRWKRSDLRLGLWTKTEKWKISVLEKIRRRRKRWKNDWKKRKFEWRNFTDSQKSKRISGVGFIGPVDEKFRKRWRWKFRFLSFLSRFQIWRIGIALRTNSRVQNFTFFLWTRELVRDFAEKLIKILEKNE